jgi:hypothetical protein
MKKQKDKNLPLKFKENQYTYKLVYIEFVMREWLMREWLHIWQDNEITITQRHQP